MKKGRKDGRLRKGGRKEGRKEDKGRRAEEGR